MRRVETFREFLRTFETSPQIKFRRKIGIDLDQLDSHRKDILRNLNPNEILSLLLDDPLHTYTYKKLKIRKTIQTFKNFCQKRQNKRQNSVKVLLKYIYKNFR